jgi:hypothetical protein
MATVQEILQQDIQRSGGDFNKTYQELQKHLGNNMLRILRAGNTLLLLSVRKNGTANVHIATIDSPRELVGNIKKLYEGMKAAGFTKATSVVTNPMMTKVLDQAGIKYRVQKKPSATGAQEFSIEIGA